jgi:hypothetical protein
MAEEVRQYQRNWKEHIARMTTRCLQGKHIVTILWEHITCIDIEREGRNSPSIFRIGFWCTPCYDGERI